MLQEAKRHVANLPRPWQIVAAGGAISCGVRANILRRPSKDLNFWGFGRCLKRCSDSLFYVQRYEKKSEKASF
jgi:hypothetical protein